MITVLTIKEVCDKIMRCDRNMRMVAISYRTDFFFLTRRGVRIFQTKDQIEKSLADAALRWVSRRSLASLGRPVYAMAKYEKVKRITIAWGLYGIVLCTINKDANAEAVASKVIRILGTHRE